LNGILPKEPWRDLKTGEVFEKPDVPPEREKLEKKEKPDDSTPNFKLGRLVSLTPSSRKPERENGEKQKSKRNPPRIEEN